MMRIHTAGTSDNWQSARAGLHAWNNNTIVTGDPAFYLHKAQHRLLDWILQYGFGTSFAAPGDVNQLINDLGEMVVAWGTSSQITSSGAGVFQTPFLSGSGASALLVSAMQYLETLLQDPYIGMALEEDDLNSADYWHGLLNMSLRRVDQIEQNALNAEWQAGSDAYSAGERVTVGGTGDNYLNALAGLKSWNSNTIVQGDQAFYLHKAQIRLADWIDRYDFGDIFVDKSEAPELLTELRQMVAAWGSPSQITPSGAGIFATPWLSGSGASDVLVRAMKQFESIMGNPAIGIALQEDDLGSEDYYHGLFRLSLLKIDQGEAWPEGSECA